MKPSSYWLRFDHLNSLIINRKYLKKVWKFINFNDNPNTVTKYLQDLIQFLQSNHFKAERPNCNGKMDLSEMVLFEAERFTPDAKELLKERKQFNKERKVELQGRLGKMSQKIEIRTQSMNIGLILDPLAPALK